MGICLQLKGSFEMHINCIWEIIYLIWVSVHALTLLLTDMVFHIFSMCVMVTCH